MDEQGKQAIGNYQMKLDYMWSQLMTKVNVNIFSYKHLFSNERLRTKRYSQIPRALSGIEQNRRPASQNVDSKPPTETNKAAARGLLQRRATSFLGNSVERRISNSLAQLFSIMR
jgi:hypothetical protein